MSNELEKMIAEVRRVHDQVVIRREAYQQADAENDVLRERFRGFVAKERPVRVFGVGDVAIVVRWVLNVSGLPLIDLVFLEREMPKIGGSES